MTVLAGKRVLLVVSGGIAAYKTFDLIRRLRERAAGVRCVLTAGGAQFVTPLSLAAHSGNPVHSARFSDARTGPRVGPCGGSPHIAAAAVSQAASAH